MKTSFSLLCIALTLVVVSVASAQFGQQFGNAPQFGGAIGQSAFRNTSTNLFQGTTGSRVGRLWFETSLADDGLGFNGSYLSLGGKTRIGEDRLDGRYLFEAQIGHSIEEEGGFFSSVGVERVFSIPAARADFSFGVWWDFDGDRQTQFANTLHQVGVSASIKSERFDLIGNGYFPTGVQDNAIGDPNGIEYFFGNSIILEAGTDSALQGFDVTLRLRPKQLAHLNGFVDFGGYGYNSDLVDSFGGGRVRLGFQGARGLLVTVEVNHDNRFNTTGVLQLGWIFGANAGGHGNEYSQQGRDLERTVRNDRIVRFTEDPVLAIDPDTGLAFNVVHVNNNADAGVETGTAETPFATLAAAEANSSPGDIIFVDAGDGTDRNLDQGIVLQDDQRLFGSGAPILLGIQGGQNLLLNHDPDGLTPTISNAGDFAVVTLADDNEVAGINIDASGADFGIFGNGDGATIQQNTVANANIDGFRFAGTGDVTITSNTFNDNGRNGVFLLNQLDTTANISIVNNTANGNILDGIGLLNFDPALLEITNNTTNNNLRHGLSLENYISSTDNPLNILGHTADSNAVSGVVLNGGSGNLNILDSTISNNGATGLLIEDFTTIDPEQIFIGATEGGVSTISGNGALANIAFVLDDPGAQSDVLITGQTLDDGINGITAVVEGFDAAGAAAAGAAPGSDEEDGFRTTLDIDIIDNLSISNNLNNGIGLTALDSGLIRANIANTDPNNPLQIVGNASAGGDGIQLLADGADGQPEAEIQADIDNVFINNSLNIIEVTGAPDLLVATDGIGVDGINNSFIDLDVINSTIGAADGADGLDTQNGIRLNLDNNGSELINLVNIDNVNFFNDIGVSLFTGDQTFTDFTLANSQVRPNGAQSTDGVGSDDAPFVDGTGSIGLFVNADGQATPTGLLNVSLPNSELPNFFATISDGVEDNLTRVTVLNTSIQDFTFEGVDVNTTGDAQLLLTLTGNDISNNGAGNNNDADNDNVFNEQPVAATGNPTELFFFDGVDINAFDDSTISTSISGNTFRDNFERGLSLNTFSTATINAVLENNVFFGNDRGEDGDNTFPPVGVGDAEGFTDGLATAGAFDLEIINNEEFFFRNFESLVFTDGGGAPVMLDGDPLPANSPGIPFPGNTGQDIFGGIVAQGTAELNASLSNNSLQLGPEVLDFAVPPGDLTLGLDGLTNGFGFGFFGIGPGVTQVGTGLAETLFSNEELFFEAEGFQ